MSEKKIQLIVGLGNPGNEYENTRHNAGFWFVEQLAGQFRESFRLEKKFFGEVCKISIAGSQCWLLKPTTFMNKSGQAVAAMAAFYKLEAENVLVAHDELDHDPGSIKLKMSGGHAGHNGLRDIISALGTRDFYRLRLGIGHPGSKSQVVNYVLGQPSRGDREKIDNAVVEALSIIDFILAGDMEKAMNRLHSN